MQKIALWLLAAILLLIAIFWFVTRGDIADLTVDEVAGTDPVLQAPDAETIPTVNIAEPIGWDDGTMPDAAAGLSVNAFVTGLKHPRIIHTLPNGDVLVTLTGAPPSKSDGGIKAWIEGLLMSRAGATDVSANTLMLLRDTNGDGVADRKIALTDNLASPSGIAWANDTLYVANHNALLSFPYVLGAETIEAAGKKLMDLPPGGGHWMRNIELSPDNTKIYVAVGSVSNIGEKGMQVEEGRAAIWEYDLTDNRPRMFAAGLRNPNGLDWSPWSGELWTTVNERDMLGSDLVPDYLTNVPVGAQYGWPWVYYKDQFDDRVDAPRPQFLTEYTRRPEYALGPHVAALGLVFTAEGARMGEKFSSGAFIARHGSWNCKPASGYDVVYIAFDALGNPIGKPVPVLTGFLTGDGTTRGRPTWVEWASDGALLVSDDTAGIIWRVLDSKAQASAAIKPLEGGSLPPQRQLSGESRATFEDDFVRQ